MAEYIEREAIQKRLNRIVEVNNLRTDLAWFTPYGVNALIEEIPAADVRPVVRGVWNAVKGVLHPAETSAVCSNCGFATMIYAQTFYNYCPNCGAMMEES